MQSITKQIKSNGGFRQVTVKKENGQIFYTAKSGKFTPYVPGRVRGAVPQMVKELIKKTV